MPKKKSSDLEDFKALLSNWSKAYRFLELKNGRIEVYVDSSVQKTTRLALLGYALGLAHGTLTHAEYGELDELSDPKNILLDI